MINAIIIDDEQHNVINLQRLLEQHCKEVTVVATATNADDGIAMIRLHQPNLVFLDIQMPGKTGFDLLLALPKVEFETVFVTAFDQYGIPAVKFSAMDYLMKPVNVEELKGAVQKALSRKSNSLEHLVAILKQGARRQEHRIALPSAKETRFVYVKDIVRCESSNSYTTFYMQDGEKIVVSVSIYEYAEMLGEYGFLRCHQSHIINKLFVRSIVKEGGFYVQMQGGEKIPVSRDKKDWVKKEMGL